MPKKQNSVFQKIEGIKKIVYCKSCGKRLEVNNFNRMLCDKCGYRESRSKAEKSRDAKAKKTAAKRQCKKKKA